ncbi:hypothetical protein [Nonomuraea rhizosphaerae]|uniref:hypothetical protein n=1 Tax=Nonomuraea rhizosphaerae TaxID=2665663 RepID=UPI001C5E1999|nr:hypothetical protein [Nonomuraea rhizosphaerae]
MARWRSRRLWPARSLEPGAPNGYTLTSKDAAAVRDPALAASACSETVPAVPAVPPDPATLPALTGARPVGTTSCQR